jgi:hypothetical protein
MAPAPIPRKIIVAIGEYKNPPIHDPIMVGTPAINPIRINFAIANFLFLAIGATIASPSVVLCNVKPRIRKELIANFPE